MTSICLNMIVCNESAVISRALDSVADLVDYWVICDTGSTDDTPALIEDYFHEKKIPGELHRCTWKNFGHNRNEALGLARGKADYLLLIDADMVVRDKTAFEPAALEADSYLVLQRNGELSYYNKRLLKNSLDWKCVGVTHESYTCGHEIQEQQLNTLWIEDIGDGGSKQNKFLRDIQLLEKGIDEEPRNTRYHFYLAQSYKDVGRLENAIDTYRQRIELGGWEEEAWYARLMIGKCLADLQRDQLAITTLQESFDERPWRAEPLVYLCELLMRNAKHASAMTCAELGRSIAYPDNDILFIDSAAYQWRFDYFITLTAYYTGEIRAGREATERLLQGRTLPAWVRHSVSVNHRYYIRSLEAITGTPLDKHSVEPAVTNLNFINPSIMRSGNGYLVNLRGINFRNAGHAYFELGSGEAISNDVPAITTNFLQHLDANLQPAGSQQQLSVDPGVKPACYPSAVIGYEDGRLIEHNGETWLLTTSREHQRDNINQMVLLHIEGKKVDRVVVMHGFENNLYQKNWMPFIHHGELLLLYACEPLTILRPDLETGHCAVVSEAIPPVYCGLLRGGSQGIRIDNHILFMVHEVVDHDEGRHYYHRFLVLDDTFEFVSLSEAFYFEHTGIEFAAGLCLDKARETLIIAWGSRDEKALFSQLPLDAISTTVLGLPPPMNAV